MIRRDLSPAEVRVLGCLVEKQRTTPEQYPLTRNALRLACNQSTNRDPVVDYDEATMRAAVERLGRNGLVRFTSTQGSRTAKYRHLVGDRLGIGAGELAVLCLLMLRGPQTPGELRGRSDRLHSFPDTGGVEAALSQLIEAGLAVRFARQPGQKEQRFGHLLSADARDADDLPAVGAGEPAATSPNEAPPLPAAAGPSPEVAATGGLEGRVAALEADVRALREELADLLED